MPPAWGRCPVLFFTHTGAPLTSRPSKLLAAVEAGGTKFVCAVGRDPRAILRRTVIPTTTPDQTFARCCEFFEGCAAEFGACSGVGVASFGPINLDERSAVYGMLGLTPKEGWAGANFVQRLSQLNAPVKVDTDVNGAALGEWAHGTGMRRDTVAYVTIGTGIGVGVVSGGHSLKGATHYELGHIRPPRDLIDSFKGRCPFHGDCLEGLASGPAIRERWGADLGALGETHKALRLEARYLAHLVLTITLAHAPDIVIVGGGVAKAAGLLPNLREETARLIGGYLAGAAEGDLSHYIVEPGLGDDAGVTGALMLAADAAQAL